MQFSPSSLRLWVAGLALAASVSAPLSDAAGQDYRAIARSTSPLVLDDVGSFMVGGETIADAQGRHITVNQMYVRYMRPHGSRATIPVILVHGGGLTGKSYETKPDGGMGWEQYFARKGYPVFVPDQVTRGRSAFDPTIFNQVRAGQSPASALPAVKRISDEDAWVTFRIGPRPGVPFRDTQFPITAIQALSRQGSPSMGSQPRENYPALAQLAADVNGAVLMGHSESGQYPIEAALVNAAGIRGMVMLEPSCTRVSFETKIFSPYGDAEVSRLTQAPMLIVFGDHLDMPWMLGRSWQDAFDDCMALIKRVNAAGGDASMLYPPGRGVHGNTHMLMNDRNSDQIADWIIEWMHAKVEPNKRPGG